MATFTTVLVPGSKRPYDTWTFVVVPDAVVTKLGSKRPTVRGTIEGVEYRGTVSRGEGVYRMPVPRELQEAAGIGNGDRVRVKMDLDPEPREVAIPAELRAVLATEADLARRFDALPPAHRRAWASHVAEAKQEATRLRRAKNAIAGIRGKKFPGG
jgi:hypothetical protein